MRNKIMFMVSAGSAALILSGAAMADAPIKFGLWGQSGATISADACTTGGITCSVSMSGDNFLQRTITVPGVGNGSPVQYIQTILSDPLTGFKDENFVRMGAEGGNGISGKQTITDNTTNLGTVFTSTAELQTGWAAPAIGNRVTLTQGLVQDAVNFTSNFGFSQTTNDTTGAVTGKSLDLGQSVSIAQTGVAESVNDKQLFVLRERQGTFNPAPPGSFKLNNDETVAYAAGEDVKVIWIGQGVAMGTGLGAQDFGYQSYTNLDPNNEGVISKFDTARMGPFDHADNPWKTALFGAKPVYATPPVINPK